MKSATALKLIAGLCLLISLSAVAAKGNGRLFHWVDDDGVTHYGDRIPAEYASGSHNVLNQHGVQVEQVAGEKTVEQLAAEARVAEAAEQKRKEMEAARLRDRVLLSTYLSVDEIEALRDRRAELLAGQVRVTQLYLDNLRRKLTKLEKEARRFSPYNIDPNARPMDERLARELSDTLDSIMLYEENLVTSQDEQMQLVAKFDSDINRFKELNSRR
jgi:hypothetical protein